MPSAIHRLALASLLAAALVSSQVTAAGLADPAAVPHLDQRGQDAYREYLRASPHRAFAIAPGGTWGWSAEAESPDLAERAALANCQANTRQACMTYAQDDRVVLDAVAWTRAWEPYPSAAEAARAKVGMQRGERFPDLAFRDARGKPIKLSSLRGQVVVLHFWGSWCPPCRREMPDLARLVAGLKHEKAIRFVFLQVREDFTTSRRWAESLAKGLPLHDSGMKKAGDGSFALADGGRLADRAVAMAFPTTYVLDRHGIVLFSHVGPVARWDQYAPFLRDAAAGSGR